MTPPASLFFPPTANSVRQPRRLTLTALRSPPPGRARILREGPFVAFLSAAKECCSAAEDCPVQKSQVMPPVRFLWDLH